MEYDFYFLLFILIGLYTIAGAAFNWEWFMRNPKANVFVRLLGRTGTRILYSILGCGLIFIGIWGLFGLPD
jgi:hypothetical protein